MKEHKSCATCMYSYQFYKKRMVKCRNKKKCINYNKWKSIIANAKFKCCVSCANYKKHFEHCIACNEKFNYWKLKKEN